MRRPFVAVAVALTAMFSGAVAAAWAEDEGKLARYGRHLAQECTSCHRLDGVDNGIPSIVGWPQDAFIATMQFYRSGARTNPVMISVANSLSDEQLRALAVYFASVPKAPRAANTTPK